MSFHVHNSYTYWISRLASTMQEKFNKDLEALDVTWPQWMIINLLSRHKAETPAALADLIGINRSAVSRLLDRLEKKGLIARIHNDIDRRSVKIRITEPGAMMVRHLDEAAERHQEEFLAQLELSELHEFKITAQKLLRAGGVESKTSWKYENN